jgi:hypothetical protein
MKTNTVSQFIGKNTMVTSDCVAIAFFRPSGNNQDVRVNGVPIEAGQTLTISQQTGNFDKTQYEVVFTPHGMHTAELYVIRQLLMG